MRPREILFCSDFPAGYHNPEAEERATHLVARGHRVVYVEMFGIRDPRPRHLARALRALRPGRTSGTGPAQTFEIVSPRLLPPRRAPGIARINRRLLTRQLVGRLRSPRESIVWVRFPSPELVAVVEACEPRLLVYELVDEHRDSMTSSGHLKLYDQAERALLRRAGLVLANSEPVRARLEALRPGTVLFEAAAVELARFEEAASRIDPEPRTALYLGGIDRRVDVSLLREAAQRLPDWKFKVVGPAEPAQLGGLQGVANLEVAGPVPPTEAPALMASAAVCLMPYAQIDYNRTLFPVKLIHYLAAGRPIATVPLEAIGPFEDLVELGEGGTGFAEAIVRATETDDAEARCRRQERAGAFSWDARINLLEGYLEGALSSAESPS